MSFRARHDGQAQGKRVGKSAQAEACATEKTQTLQEAKAVKAGIRWTESEMYGLQKSTDVSFLKGRELIQIAIGVFQVQFNFDQNVGVSVEGEFQYIFEGKPFRWTPGSPESAAAVLRLLGSSVEELMATEDGTLTLTFTNGDSLIVKDSSAQYESYTISGGPNGLIVV
jgi:uncharacterized protein DUF6188